MSGPDRFPGGLGALGIHKGLVTNYGGGGATKREGWDKSSFTPKKGGGAEKVLAIPKRGGGRNSFG